MNHPAAPCRHGHLKAKNNKLAPHSITHKHAHMQMSVCSNMLRRGVGVWWDGMGGDGGGRVG